MNRMTPRLLILSLVATALTASALAARTEGALAGGPIVLTPDRDNTLFENLTGALSNGIGPHVFAGSTIVGSQRRAVLRFDVAAVLPPDAVIESVRVELEMDQTIASEVFVGFHRVLGDWGEGASSSGGMGGGGGGAPSEMGDATWLHTFFPGSLWTTEGGDFIGTASAITSVDGVGTYTWASTPALIADVEQWRADPAANFGWLVFADESITPSAKRFASRENPDPAVRPRLIITLVGSDTIVPTLSTGMLALFVLLLAAAAAVSLGRRQPA
jgi:hypothetical protein